MPMFKGLVVVASLATATSAMAASSHLTDSQYMQAARCRALIASPGLGKGDATAIDALLKVEERGRSGDAYQRADEMRRDAAGIAANPSPGRRSELIAERDGPCVAFTGGAPAMAAAGHQATTN